jgi:predicted enzyme related to lactoylglutathione lyase
LPAYGTSLHEGTLGGLQLLLCPNEIARVNAEQNRHQLKFHVENIADSLKRVVAAGGSVQGEVTEFAGEKIVAVRDPDGNTIELAEPAARG